MYSLKLTIKSLQNLKKLAIRYRFLKIKKFFKKKYIKIQGIIPFKKKNIIYTVLRSPHVNKKSREHFNYNYYKQSFHIISSKIYNLIHILVVFRKILPKNLLLKVQLNKN